jgi:hypothetical protein
MVSSEVGVLNKNVNKIDFVFPSTDCSSCSAVRVAMKRDEGAIKTIIGTKTDLGPVHKGKSYPG